jgi:hypothetical protein
MKNEPVAWMDEINTFVLDKDYKQFPKSLQNGMIPLYTHPVKELTNEEIMDFINAFCLDMGDYWELTERNAIPMIRAILKKAKE